jgi:hypothetical protein
MDVRNHWNHYVIRDGEAAARPRTAPGCKCSRLQQELGISCAACIRASRGGSGGKKPEQAAYRVTLALLQVGVESTGRAVAAVIHVHIVGEAGTSWF